MTKAKLFQYSDIIFILSISVLTAIILYFLSNEESQKQQQKLYEHTVHDNFIASLAQVKSNAMLLYQLQYNNGAIKALVENANRLHTSDNDLVSIKDALYKRLKMEYQASRDLFPHQQVFMRNGQSLLHLDAHTLIDQHGKEGTSVLDKVLKTHEVSFGLSLIAGEYRYQYTFPLFNERNYLIGAVELAMPISQMQRSLKHSLNAKSQFLFVKRQLAHLEHKSQLYNNSHLEDIFYTPVQNIAEIDKGNQLEQSDLQQIKSGLSSQDLTKLLQLKRFAFATSIDGQDGTAVFIPIYNIQGNDIGGIITFAPGVKLSLSKTDILSLNVLISLLFLLILLYIIKKSACLYYMQIMYQHFIDAIPFPVFLKYDGSQYLRANKAFYQFFNIPKKKLLSKNQGFDSEPEMLRVSLTEINEFGGCYEQQYEDYKDGQPFIYKLFFFATKPRKYSSQGIIGYVQDITEKKQLNDSLQASIYDQNQFMDLLPVGIRVFNLEGTIIYLNKTFEKISGYSESDFINEDCTSLFSCLQCDFSTCPLKKVTEFRKSMRIETIKYNKQHQAGTYEVCYEPHYSVDKQLVGVVEITRDITQDKSLLDKNHELMLSDELTGLYNYRGLLGAGENYFRLAARANKAFFILYVNIYGMEKINTEYGEKEGDSLLKTFAAILIETFRETDIIARTGGDEFVILMNDSEYEVEDNSCFARLEHNVNKYNEQQMKGYSLLIDTGIVEFHKQRHENLQALISEGEQLVYEHRFNRTLN